LVLRSPDDEGTTLIVEAEDQRARGIAGFRALGPAAQGAAPALIKLADDFQADAERALVAIGPGAVDCLIEALQHEETKLSAPHALCSFGRAAIPAVPRLITLLSDPNSDVREQVANALGKIGEESDLVVPALIKTLGDREYHVRSEAMRALGRFGHRAENAVPALLVVRKNSRIYAEILDAYSALKKIDPEVAASKGVAVLPQPMVPPMYRP
jgi:HEAT repeat protein